MSNLPPGVTGNEWQIAGPDWEDEEQHRCVPCDAVTTHAVVSYHGSTWKTCEVCLHESVIEVPEDEGYEDRRQQEIDREGEEWER